MSVYTTLTLKEVQDFTAPYGLNVADLIPIQGGIQNTNYFIVCENGQQYVLTIFEEMDEQLAQAQAIAVAQAKMHVALQDFPLERAFYRDHAYWRQVSREVKPSLNDADAMLLNNLLGVYDALTAMYPNRPKGFIHSDLFRDNTLFDGDELKGILDFYELNKDEWLFDIAITLNDFCTEYPSVTLNEDKAVAFLNAYESVRPLTADEKACLELYLAMAAGRFWMMRLQVAQKNAAEGRTGGDILQKNPAEMRDMLIERLKFVTA